MAKVAVLVVCLIKGALCLSVFHSMVSAVGFSLMPLWSWRNSLLFLVYRVVFVTKRCWILCDAFPASADDHGGFPFTPLRPCSTWTDPFPSPPCLPGRKPLGHSASAFRYALGFHCWYFAEDFCACIWKRYCSFIFFFVVYLSGFVCTSVLFYILCLGLG